VAGLTPRRPEVATGSVHVGLVVDKIALDPVWWAGLKNGPTVTHAYRKRRLKWVPSAWEYSWATLSPGVINTEAWSSRLGVGRWTNNPAL
jgi:hypothetical protein